MKPKPYTLLIVDDNRSNIELLFHSLNTQYNIQVAKNGTTAVKVATEKKPDLILLDIAMPGMDGFDVIKKHKTNAITASIPVIFVTGKSNYEHRIRGYQLGAVDYIAKPFELMEVKSRIKAQLQLHDNARDMMLMNQILRYLSIFYWRYNHTKKTISTCGSLEECIDIEVSDSNIFSSSFQAVLSDHDRAKREKTIKHFMQDPHDYIIKYRLSQPEGTMLLEKGFVSNTEPHISFGFIANITKGFDTPEAY